MTLLAKLSLDKNEAWKIYRELLQRQGSPEPGDEELLQKVMLNLGRSMEEVVADANALNQADHLQREIDADNGEAMAQVKAVSKRMEDFEAKSRRIDEELRDEDWKILMDQMDASSRAEQLRETKMRLSRLRRKHSEVLGLSPMRE